MSSSVASNVSQSRFSSPYIWLQSGSGDGRKKIIRVCWQAEGDEWMLMVDSSIWLGFRQVGSSSPYVGIPWPLYRSMVQSALQAGVYYRYFSWKAVKRSKIGFFM